MRVHPSLFCRLGAHKTGIDFVRAKDAGDRLMRRISFTDDAIWVGSPIENAPLSWNVYPITRVLVHHKVRKSMGVLTFSKECQNGKNTTSGKKNSVFNHNTRTKYPYRPAVYAPGVIMTDRQDICGFQYPDLWEEIYLLSFGKAEQASKYATCCRLEALPVKSHHADDAQNLIFIMSRERNV